MAILILLEGSYPLLRIAKLATFCIGQRTLLWHNSLQVLKQIWRTHPLLIPTASDKECGSLVSLRLRPTAPRNIQFGRVLTNSSLRTETVLWAPEKMIRDEPPTVLVSKDE